jgi:hypothetical protein
MARLPVPGGDSGNWGDVLNNFLVQAHSSDGTLKSDTVGASQLQDGAVGTSQIQGNAVTSDQLSSELNGWMGGRDSDVQTVSNNVNQLSTLLRSDPASVVGNLSALPIDKAGNSLQDLVESLDHVYTGGSATATTVTQRKNYPIMIYDLGGTGTGLLGTPDTSWPYVHYNLDAATFTWMNINYPATVYPMGQSIVDGANNLINAINAHPGGFILHGISQGAAVISKVYDEIRYGSLTHRRNDLLGVFAYGNPCREEGATFPGGPAVPGHGAADVSMRTVGTESLFWNFSNPGDIVGINYDGDPTSEFYTQVLMFLMTSWSGFPAGILRLLSHPPENAIQMITDLVGMLQSLSGPHQNYPHTKPLAAQGDDRTCYQIVFDQIASLAPLADNYPIAGSDATASSITKSAEALRNKAATAQNSTITLANIANTTRPVPFYVSPNPLEDVAFPRADLRPVPAIDNGGGSPAIVWNEPLVTIPAGQVVLSVVGTTQNRIYNTLGFITNGATPPATVYCKLQLVDIVTGNIVTEYNLGNISGNITTGTVGTLVDSRITLPNDIVAQQDAIWMVSILPIGSSLSLAGIRRSDMPYTGLYPSYSTGVLNGQSAIPDSIADASLSASSYRIWVCLGQATQEDSSPVTVLDTFNVSNTSSYLPASFNSFNTTSPDRSTMSIYNQQAVCWAGASPADGNYYSSKLSKTPLNTDDHAVELTLGTSGWDASTYNHVNVRAYVRCRNNGTSGVAMILDASSATSVRLRITTIANMVSVGTVQATVTGITGNPGDTFRIEANGNTYTCYRNDTAIPGASWTDSGNIIPINSNFRSVGYGHGSYKHNAGFSVDTPAGIDEFCGYDLVV